MSNLVKVERPMAAKVLDGHLVGHYPEPLSREQLSALSVYVAALEAANVLLQSRLKNTLNDLSSAINENRKLVADIEDTKGNR